MWSHSSPSALSLPPRPPPPAEALTDEWGDGRGEYRTALDHECHGGTHQHGKVAGDPGEGGGKVCGEHPRRVRVRAGTAGGALLEEEVLGAFPSGTFAGPLLSWEGLCRPFDLGLEAPQPGSITPSVPSAWLSFPRLHVHLQAPVDITVLESPPDPALRQAASHPPPSSKLPSSICHAASACARMKLTIKTGRCPSLSSTPTAPLSLTKSRL